MSPAGLHFDEDVGLLMFRGIEVQLPPAPLSEQWRDQVSRWRPTLQVPAPRPYAELIDGLCEMARAHEHDILFGDLE